MNPRIKELLSNTMLFTIANMGSKILVFLMVPLYTAVLTTEEYGVSDMVQTTADMLFPLLTVMISEAVLRFCFIKDVETKDVFTIGIRFTAKSILICMIISAVFYFLPFFKPLGGYLFFIPLMFATRALVNLFHKFARGIDKVKVSAYGGLLSTSIAVALNLFFLLVLKIGVTGYLLAYFLADVVTVFYMAVKCNARSYIGDTLNSTLRSEMLKYSVPLVPNSLSWWALSSVNRYIMLAWVGVSAVGIYSATLRIPSILTVLSDIFAQAWLLSALKNYGSDESKQFIKAMHNRIFSLLIVMTSGIILLSEPLAKLLLSGEFSSYWTLIPYLFISVFWGALVGFLGSIFSAERKNTMQFVSTVIGAVVSILITVLFLRKYGVIVVAIATWAAYYVIWLIRRIAVRKYIDIGYGASYSSLQGVILLLESILVGKGLYLYSGLCLILLMLLNYQNVWQIICFSFNETTKFFRTKIKR